MNGEKTDLNIIMGDTDTDTDTDTAMDMDMEKDYVIAQNIKKHC